MQMKNTANSIQTADERTKEEHILVCLSSSPSNEKIIRAAAKMAEAFKGSFTALFVETSDFSKMSEVNKKRLKANMHLAKQLGAKIEIVYGDDVAFHISEFARQSGVTKVVIGRNTNTKRYFIGKPTLAEKLIGLSFHLDIYIIPDSEMENKYRVVRERRSEAAFSIKDILKCIFMLALATIIGNIFWKFGFSEANIITIYILCVVITAVITTRRIYSIVASLISVIIFNFFFTVPRNTLFAYDKGYVVTFLVMFVAAFLTGSLTVKLKEQVRQSARAAYRTKILFDTNQLLEKVTSRKEIVEVTASQLNKLLGRDMVVYLVQHDKLESPQIFHYGENAFREEYISEEEQKIAEWVLKNNRHAGATTDTYPNSKLLYFSIRLNEHIYGVVGIVMHEGTLDSFENSILLSILGECALALENEKNTREKKEAELLAQQEKLRANLLRSISHDLRTPLTSISGNASNLLSNDEAFDHDTKKQLYADIYDDSLWLINLVENLLSVTRIEQGQMKLNVSTELMDEVVTEALQHIDRKSREHKISVYSSEEFILAKIDARLIVQVIINIVDNAVKYTPKGSEIKIKVEKKDGSVWVSIADNGQGIPNAMKPYVFDMFFTGEKKVADSRRSMGLGLALCKSIINAHGGEISVEDNVPTGSIFKFSLPLGEVSLNE